jgi:hypothetical protein
MGAQIDEVGAVDMAPADTPVRRVVAKAIELSRRPARANDFTAKRA